MAATKPDHDESMSAGTMLVCDVCEAWTDRSERGWRALLRPVRNGRPVVIVVCPCCAEVHLGEDEISAPDRQSGSDATVDEL